MQLTRRRRLLGTAVALTAVVVTGLSACSSDDGSSSSTEPSANESALGTANKATGTPVTIGFISDGKSQFSDNSDEIAGAKAAAEYANNYLGGINGHPINFKICETRLVPSAGTDCANQMVAAKAAAVVEGTASATDATVDPLAAAKIPLILHTASSQKTLTTPGVYSLFSGVSTFGVAAKQAKDAGATKASIIVIGVPAAEAAAQQIGKLVYGNAGIGVDVVAIPPGTADATPQITAANQKKPGAYLVLGNEEFCTSALKPLRTINPNAKITITDRCIGPAGAKSIPNGYKGIGVTTSGDLDRNSEDAKIFDAALAKYGDGGQFNAASGFGWAPTLALVEMLNNKKVTDVTPANVLTAIQTAPALPYPLGGGVTFQCNGQQVALSPFICGSDGVIATAAQDGSLTDFTKVDLDPTLFKIPGR